MSWASGYGPRLTGILDGDCFIEGPGQISQHKLRASGEAAVRSACLMCGRGSSGLGTCTCRVHTAWCFRVDFELNSEH